MEELAEPERVAVENLCRIYSSAAVNRFWWTGVEGRTESIRHLGSTESIPASRAVMEALERELVIHLLPGSALEDGAAQFALTDRGFDLCSELIEQGDRFDRVKTQEGLSTDGD